MNEISSVLQFYLIFYYFNLDQKKRTPCLQQLDFKARLSTTCYYLDSSSDKTPNGGKRGGSGKGGQLCCPKCGEPCTHVETFVCKCC